MSHLMTKPAKWHVRPAKTQISLGIRPVWSESSLCAKWVAKDPGFLHVDSEDSDQTGWMPRLIRVFNGRTCHFVGFVMRRLIYLTSVRKLGELTERFSQAHVAIVTFFEEIIEPVRSAKTPISLVIHPVWSESSLCA